MQRVKRSKEVKDDHAYQAQLTKEVFESVAIRKQGQNNLDGIQKSFSEQSGSVEALSLYLTPKQFVEKYKFMPMGGLRHLLFNSSQNGLDKAILRIGKRKILISEQEFFLWLTERNCKGGSHE